MGAELESEFGEKMAPSQEYGELLGHSLYFYSKDVGQPVTNQLEDGLAVERTLLDVRLSGHGGSFCAGGRRFPGQ